MSFDDVANVNADAVADAQPLTCVVDDFTTLDMERWFPYGMGPTLQVTGGELVIAPAPNTIGYAGLNSRAIDFTGGNAAIEVPLVVGQPNVENYLLVFDGPGHVHEDRARGRQLRDRHADTGRGEVRQLPAVFAVT